MVKIKERLNHLSYVYLIDALLFMSESELNNTLNNLEEMADINDFSIIFNEFITAIYETKSYPNKIKTNVLIIIDYLNKKNINLDSLKNIVETTLETYPLKYEIEYEKKYEEITRSKKDSFVTLNLNNFSDSLKFDYNVVIYLLEEDKEAIKELEEELYMDNYFPGSIRKILHSIPEVLDKKIYYDKITRILKRNIDDLNKQDNEVASEYVYKNYTNISSNNIVTTGQLNSFKEECDQLLFEIRYKMEFPLEAFKELYNIFYIEYAINSDAVIDNDTISLNNIYNYIDRNIEYPLITNKAKNKLLNFMNYYRKNLKGDDLIKYNKYLVKLNELDTNLSKKNLFTFRASSNDYLKFILNQDFDLFNRIVDYKYVDYINLLFATSEDSIYMQYKDNFDSTYLPDSIKFYLKKFPFIFLDKKVLERFIEGLDYYDSNDAIKLKKKLKKKL